MDLVETGTRSPTPGGATTEDVWALLAPTMLAAGVVAVAVVAYAVRTHRLGRWSDEEMDDRGGGGLFHRKVRHFFAWVMRPLWQGLVAAGVPPNAITTLALGLALGAGVGVALGRFGLGGWLFIVAGALDFLDGRVAREAGRATRSGAVLDSVIDRYCESALLVGLAWYYRGSTTLVAALLALTGSLFVPYVRARGEAIGVVMKEVGFMQRPERIVLLGFGVALAPAFQVLVSPSAARPSYHLSIVVLWFLAATSHITALQRLLFLLRALGGRAASALGSFTTVPHVRIAGTVATFGDYLVAHDLVAFGILPAPAATAVGCVVGGMIALALSRHWTFGIPRAPLPSQVARYAFVSGTTAGLGAGAVALVLLIPDASFPVGWVVARGLVFLTWTYPLSNDVALPRGERRLPPGGPASAPPSTPRVVSGAKVAT
jgi:phosphatidylglycerophosphate synthase